MATASFVTSYNANAPFFQMMRLNDVHWVSEKEFGVKFPVKCFPCAALCCKKTHMGWPRWFAWTKGWLQTFFSPLCTNIFWRFPPLSSSVFRNFNCRIHISGRKTVLDGKLVWRPGQAKKTRDFRVYHKFKTVTRLRRVFRPILPSV